jgi:hypothetical protein
MKIKRLLRLPLRALFIAAGLYGGWLAAGVLNNHRNDVPRPIPPTTLPSRHQQP